MIVDDMEIMRKEIKRLKLWGDKTGFVVAEEANNGQEACDKLEKRKVDLIITDIRMPIMDGIELLKEVIENDLAYCIVFMSEYCDFEYARQGLIYGAFDYIVKPIDENKVSDLLQNAKNYITKKRLNDEKIKRLNVRLEEQIENFYTEEEVENIVKLFKDVDFAVIETASDLLDTIAAAINYDFMKMSYILDKMLKNLLQRLEEIYPWLVKLIDIEAYTEIDFISCGNLTESKKVFQKMIEELIVKISKYQYGNGVSSMIRKVCEIVLENIDTEISIKNISDELFLNSSYLSTMYKEKTGRSLVEYINMVKMERAKVLLGYSNMRNYEIADKLGYKDAEYFSRLFKKYTGITPTNFKSKFIY